MIIISKNFIRENKVWTDVENQIIQYLKIQKSKKIMPIFSNVTANDLDYKFTFIKPIASLDLNTESVENCSIKISKKIFEANIKNILNNKIGSDELKRIALEYLPSDSPIRDDIGGLRNISSILDILYGFEKGLVSILNRIVNEKNIVHSNIENYTKLIEALNQKTPQESKDNSLHLNKRWVLAINKAFVKKRLAMITILFIVGVLIFFNLKNVDSMELLNKIENENQREALRLRIHNLLNNSENLIGQYLQQPPVQNENLSQRLEKKRMRFYCMPINTLK